MHIQDETEQNQMAMGEELIAHMKQELEHKELVLSQAISTLHHYAYKRVLPKQLTTPDACTEISQAIMFLGSVMELSDCGGRRYDDNFLPAWAYKPNALQTLLSKAEHLMSLDFGEYRYQSADTGKYLAVFTLEDMAELAGKQIGSIRNATLQGGDLATVRYDNVLDEHDLTVPQKVFVEREEAIRWLKHKKAYEPLREEHTEVPNLMEQVKSYGPRFDGKNLPDFLKLRVKGDLTVFYSPFEYINRDAKVVLCGITPGAAQAEIALNTLAEALQEDLVPEAALKKAKETASFAGPMRTSLSKMLNHVGLHRTLGINSCDELFNGQRHLVHYTSALRNPVFLRGGNYTGNPLMLNEPALKWQVDECLAEEVVALGADVLYIPLGPRPAEALMYLVDKGLLKESQVLAGIPHPSGANAERIKYFCEEKAREQLSSRTNARLLDEARKSIQQKLSAVVAAQ